MRFPTFVAYHQWSVDTSTYWQLLDDENKRRRDRRIPRCALRPFKFSSFKYLYSSGNEQALLNATGFDHNTFDILHDKFKHTYDHHMVTVDGIIRKKKLDEDGVPMGRVRDLHSIGALGIVLMWYRTRGSCARSLSMMFGQTSTCLYKWLKFSRKVLLQVLSRDIDSIIQLPSLEKVRFYQEVIGNKYPLCSDVWAAADGIKLLLEKSGDDSKQNYHFNGWKNGHFINCVFVFCPDGKISLCLLNAPGTFHDSTMSDYGVYKGLEAVYTLCGGKVVVDSAFKMSDANYLVRSSQRDPGNAYLLLLNRQATSIRQLSEWGMRMVQGQFPRLKDALQYEEKGERKVILTLMVHLYNFHCANIGINTIQNAYCEKTNYFGRHAIDEDANQLFV